MKRNIFLSVFLPLFLCAAILTLGYFSPTLFSRVMPNFKNKESAAQITGAESPLYLEDPSSLVLPPWNDMMILNHRCTLPITSLFRTP